MIRSAKMALMGAMVVAFAMGGCSAHPGAAAVVDGREVAEKHLDRIAEGIESVSGQATTREKLLPDAIIVTAAQPMLERAGLTEEDRAAMRKSCAQQFPTDSSGELLADFENYCYVTLLAQRDPDFKQKLSRAVGQAKIELNPRYGEFREKDGRRGIQLPSYLEDPVGSREGGS